MRKTNPIQRVDLDHRNTGWFKFLMTSLQLSEESAAATRAGLFCCFVLNKLLFAWRFSKGPRSFDVSAPLNWRAEERGCSTHINVQVCHHIRVEKRDSVMATVKELAIATMRHFLGVMAGSVGCWAAGRKLMEGDRRLFSVWSQWERELFAYKEFLLPKLIIKSFLFYRTVIFYGDFNREPPHFSWGNSNTGSALISKTFFSFPGLKYWSKYY